MDKNQYKTINKLPIIVFTPYSSAKNNMRQAELDECIQRNISCKAIFKLVLLIDDGYKPVFSHDKIEIINILEYPTYKDWIEISLNYQSSFISVMANSDVYFDKTLINLRLALKKPKSLLALSCYGCKKEQITPHPNHQWSQGAWAFNTISEINPFLLKSLDVPLSITNCANKISNLFSIYGWSIINPYQYSGCIHLYEPQERTDNNRIMDSGTYAYSDAKLTVLSKYEIDVCAGETSNSSQSKEIDTLLPCLIKPEKENNNDSFDPNIIVKDFSKNAPTENNVKKFRTQGKLVYKHLKRFHIYYLNYQLLCMDNLNLRTARIISISEPCLTTIEVLSADLLKVFIPPIVDIYPIIINERPISNEDCHFWQYPCLTEKQAYYNHFGIKLGENVDVKNRIINTYLGLPWATYIDKESYPDELHTLLKPYISGFKSLIQSNNYRLSVHSVCQQIHWKRFICYFHNLGVTDLYLSHCEKNISLESDNYRFRVHSWPLIAVNIEDKYRSMGITIGRQIEKKRFFASFIGTHMTHYRSDVRLKLYDTVMSYNTNDIFFDLGKEWHFNKIVYQEQIANQKVSNYEEKLHKISTQRYNEILSNSIFSLCPEGAGPNTLRIWESLAVGAIPVIISDDWVIPKTTTSSDLRNYCVFVKYADIGDIFNILRSFNKVKIKRMQAACIEEYNEWRKLCCY